MQLVPTQSAQLIIKAVAIIVGVWGQPWDATHIIHNNQPVFPALIGTNLWVEEDLRPQEALVAHVDGELLLADGVDPGVLLDPLGAICVVLVELFD